MPVMPCRRDEAAIASIRHGGRVKPIKKARNVAFRRIPSLVFGAYFRGVKVVGAGRNGLETAL